jgi:serine/threonine-protein kinase
MWFGGCIQPRVTDGRLQVGKYRVIAELGHGGMADVFLAVLDGPDGSGFAKLAVVKRLRPHLVEDPEWVTMLMEEARVTARLNHPNVVQMIEVGAEGREYFLAIEYLDGQPLHRIVRRATKNNLTLPSEAGYLVVADSLAGLHHAHELADYDGRPLGIVHRDVTPQNIFVTYDGGVKVVDFGIALAAGRKCETQHGVVKGKLRYMAPEQAVGVSVDRRCDIFAAGVILWEAATGRRFWDAVEEMTIVQRLIGGAFVPSPRAVRPDVPEAIDAICRRALAVRPEDRYSTAAEMQADLEAFLGARTLRIRRELTSLVSALFVRERANIRQILSASVGPIASFARDSEPPDDPTTVMANARAAPPNDAAALPPHPPSIAPMTLGDDEWESKLRALTLGDRPLADVYANVHANAPLTPASGRPRAFRGVAVGAAALIVLVGVLGTAAARLRAGTNATTTSSATAARIASVHCAHVLVRATDALSAAPHRALGSSVVGETTAATARPSLPRARGRIPVPAGAQSAPAQPQHPKLDSADPWGRGGAL